MRRKSLLFIAPLLLLFLLAFTTSAVAQHQAIFFIGENAYHADGQAVEMDAAPFTKNDRTYVPVRYLALALGVLGENIGWNDASQTVTLEKEGVTVSMAVGSKVLTKNGVSREIDVAPVLNGERAFLPARFVAEAFGYAVGWDEGRQAVLIGPQGNLPAIPDSTGSDSDDSAATGLPVIGSYEKFKELMESAQAQSVYGGGGAIGRTMQEAAPMNSAKSDSAVAAKDYSDTNVQVEGVDEADIVKTDGQYIYQVNNQRVIIAKAYPAEDMKVVKILDFTGKNLSPRELFVDENHLVVIGSSHNQGPAPLYKSEKIMGAPGIYPPYIARNTLRAVIYDISDKDNIKELREIEIEGDYVSSRKIGSALYLVANKYIYHYVMEEGVETLTPAFRDTAVKNDFNNIGFQDIRYFPECIEPNYLIVAGVNLDHPGEKAQVSAYLGSGQNIYASAKNLYVAVASYPGQPRVMMPEIWPGPVRDPNTRVYKFALNEGTVAYKGKGEVPGTVLNQFSMDEYNRHFRIATTRGEVWRTDEYTSKNNVYILDDGLEVVGRLEDIAPGERIYSVRFTGDRAYMVTFKTVDPLFVIDLEDPRNPAILGALKIPGYSDYLHPYDENHVIGFGKDTIELGQKDGEGRQTGTTAFYTGMKIALFDVTDVQHPVELFTEKIGGRGTDSELLRNHKALLFDREKELLAFPVTVMETGDSVPGGATVPSYGKFSFQGACVYKINLNEGLILRGKITHLTAGDYLKAGEYWYESNKSIERILYIDDVLYTVSRDKVKASGLMDLKEINSLPLQ
jgi:inhibitor of cysteine peptidase